MLENRSSVFCCSDSGYIDLDNPDFTPVNEIKCSIALSEMMREEDENVVVNGWILVFDCTGIGAKHIARMPLEMHRKMSKIFQVNRRNAVIASTHLLPSPDQINSRDQS